MVTTELALIDRIRDARAADGGTYAEGDRLLVRMVDQRLSEEELRDLVAYLASPAQVPLAGRSVTIDPKTHVAPGVLEGEALDAIYKQAIALASIRTPHAARGTDLQLEVTVEYERHTVTATVVDTLFLDLPRKRS